MVAPGSRLHVRLSPWFTLDNPLAGRYTARISVLNDEGAELCQAVEPLPASKAAFEVPLPAAL